MRVYRPNGITDTVVRTDMCWRFAVMDGKTFVFVPSWNFPGPLLLDAELTEAEQRAIVDADELVYKGMVLYRRIRPETP